jgi:anti-sigma factor RsiW
MNCRQAVNRLALFVGGDLPPAVAAEVEDHLENCDACGAELRRYEEARRSLFVLKGDSGGPAPDLWPSIRTQLGKPPRRVPRLLRVGAVAAAILLAVLAFNQLVLTPSPGDLITAKDGVTPSDGDDREAPEVVAVGVPVPATDPVQSDFHLDEVIVGADSAAYESAPPFTTLEPERSAWDEF